MLSESHNEPVVVLRANSITEAQIAEATLEAEGIVAYVQPTTSVTPNVGVMGDDVPEVEVLVAPEDAQRAQEILNAPPPSEEELDSFEESGPVDGEGDAVV